MLCYRKETIFDATGTSALERKRFGTGRLERKGPETTGVQEAATGRKIQDYCRLLYYINDTVGIYSIRLGCYMKKPV